MIRNYFKTAWRNILRFKLFSIINITGLSIALACSVILFLYIEHELSFDNFHQKKDDIYRCVYIKEHPNTTIYAGYSPYPLADFLRRHLPDYPATRLVNYYDMDFKIGEQIYNEKNILFVDSVFFKIFDFRWVSGQQGTSLSEPASIVLTESLASKYFPDGGALGKVISIPGHPDVKITGIMKDPPTNNSQPFTAVMPLQYFHDEVYGKRIDQWGLTMSGLENWLLLPDWADPAVVEHDLNELLDEHLDAGYSDYVRFGLQPLSEVHLAPNYQNNSGTYTTSKSNIMLVGVIGLLIVIIGSINFINLSNAQGMRRMKEIGVRKVMGADRQSVRIQFLAETYLMVLIAILFAVILVEIFLPVVNDFFGNMMDLSIYSSSLFYPFVLILFILIGLMSGFYPAAFLSRFRPVDTLKNSLKSTGGFSVYLRNTLLLLQFVITVGLLVSVFVISRQMSYVMDSDLGFNKENIIEFRIPEPTDANLREVNKMLSSNPNVGRYTFGFGAPTSSNNMGSNFSSPEVDVDDELNLNLKLVDTAYLNTFGLELLAGEWVYRKSKEDSLYKLVVNEKLVSSLGLQDPVQAIGMRLQVSGIPGTIIGVVKDFHTASLKYGQMPVAFIYLPNYFYSVMVHIPANHDETIAHINAQMADIFPDYVIDHSSVNEQIMEMYGRDESTLTLLRFFSIIALLIAFMGLFGLVSFHMVRKTKEIGIRKILGASIPGLVLVLTRWQIGLLLIATVIGGALSWYFVQDWLETYVYRISFPYWVFPVVFLLMLIVNFLTISFHVYKTARANPVDAIKYE